jgi:hypothetical protein
MFRSVRALPVLTHNRCGAQNRSWFEIRGKAVLARSQSLKGLYSESPIRLLALAGAIERPRVARCSTPPLARFRRAPARMTV